MAGQPTKDLPSWLRQWLSLSSAVFSSGRKGSIADLYPRVPNKLKPGEKKMHNKHGRGEYIYTGGIWLQNAFKDLEYEVDHDMLPLCKTALGLTRSNTKIPFSP